MNNIYLWLIWFPLVFGSFALFEGFALKHPDRQWTLSRLMAYVGAKFPLSIAILSMLFGGLLVHFYWHFCPDFAIQGG
jgi:hypothetical protein